MGGGAEGGKEPPLDPEKLGPRLQECLNLRRDGWGYKPIAKRMGVSPRTVGRWVEQLVEKGFDEAAPKPGESTDTTEGDEADTEGEKKPATASPGRQVAAAAKQRATNVAVVKAGDLSSETIDIWLKTGSWLWQTWEDYARLEGYPNAMEFTEAAISLWIRTHKSLAPLVARVGLLEQRNEELQARVETLTNRDRARQVILDYALWMSLAGAPLGGDQLYALLKDARERVEAPKAIALVAAGTGGP